MLNKTRIRVDLFTPFGWTEPEILCRCNPKFSGSDLYKEATYLLNFHQDHMSANQKFARVKVLYNRQEYAIRSQTIVVLAYIM